MAKYTIQKGRHYHNNFWQRLLMFPRRFKQGVYQVVFNEGCWYEEDDIPGIKDDNDKNKLCGLRYWKDHVNSSAFTWRPIWTEKDHINVFLYGYENKIRYNPKIPVLDIKIGQPFTCGSWIGRHLGEKGYFFFIEGKIFFWSHLNPQAWFRRQPYFGGDPVAPWKMSITMKSLPFIPEYDPNLVIIVNSIKKWLKLKNI